LINSYRIGKTDSFYISFNSFVNLPQENHSHFNALH